MIVTVKTYELSGGDTVEVHQPFGEEIYFAIADMKAGAYPEAGSVAHNDGRDEYMYLLDGEMKITIDGKTTEIKPGETVMVRSGQTYSIEGQGRSLVFVKDAKGGKTEILPKE